MYGHTAPLMEVGEGKVFDVRRRLAMGEYDVSGVLDTALDRLIDGCLAESEPGKMTDKAKGKLNETKTRILIVDDHAIVRQGLTRLVEVECDLTVCAEVENGVQALEALEHQQFDLAIVDISLDDTNGLDLTAKMKARCPSMTVLILSMYDGLLYAQRALQAGAAGYVAKYEAPEKIIIAIHQVLGGKVYVSNSKAARSLCGGVSEGDDDPDSSGTNDPAPRAQARHGVPNHA